MPSAVQIIQAITRKKLIAVISSASRMVSVFLLNSQRLTWNSGKSQRRLTYSVRSSAGTPVSSYTQKSESSILYSMVLVSRCMAASGLSIYVCAAAITQRRLETPVG